MLSRSDVSKKLVGRAHKACFLTYNILLIFLISMLLQSTAEIVTAAPVAALIEAKTQLRCRFNEGDGDQSKRTSAHHFDVVVLSKKGSL
jgi:hypothetical protein